MDDHLMSRDDGHPRFQEDHDAANLKPRACSNCARLKMKCQWPATGSARPEKTCARCARMKLSCQVPEAVPRKKRGKSTRVAQLEKKLDGIVSLLAASQQMQAKAPLPLTPESPKGFQILQPPSEIPVSQFLGFKEPVEPASCGGHCGDLGDGATNDLLELELFPGFRITHDQADGHLEAYRRDLMPVFPFVTFPEDVTSRDLYAHSPFLFWTIMSVTAQLPKDVQAETKVWFRKYIAEHVVVQQEKRLDMLQAILIYLAWSMLGDAWASMIKATPYGTKHKTSHSLEEKRAVLGYYHMSCLRGTQLSWSHFLSQCCDALLKAGEHESDKYLVAVVKMQHLTDRAYNALRTTDYYDNPSIVFRAPLDMVMTQARRELESFVETQPEVVKESKIFWSHYYILLLRLYEPVLQMKAPAMSDLDSLAGEPFMRAEALWKCVDAAGRFFNHHLSVPVAELIALPVTVSGFLAYSIVTTSRIMLLESSPDWDPALAWRQLDIADLLKRMSEQYEEADHVAKELGRRRRILDDDTSIFVKYSSKLRWIRQWYMSKIPQEPQMPLAEPPDWTVDFEFDDNFWQELMSGYDCDALNVSLPNAPVC
ncbi:hypothetical protein G7Z17_g1910 [Cylindrodendrum hubeiense]|uniref:Zn(2)-C6 fungal-type domain-containing protein n=1 Tax=Cylindrodendrum hubeiense TaxID=595255 RepID=A0A9P5LEY3_9HYPO|nr:hypothetical protein G7Z17_g1910 [Cylindrodendrum hubeiense]